jgi:hypothetical protein
MKFIRHEQTSLVSKGTIANSRWVSPAAGHTMNYRRGHRDSRRGEEPDLSARDLSGVASTRSVAGERHPPAHQEGLHDTSVDEDPHLEFCFARQQCHRRRRRAHTVSCVHP